MRADVYHGPGITSIIDYVSFGPSLSSLTSYSVGQDEFMSDYQPIRVGFECRTSPVACVEYETWKLRHLQDPSVREEYGKYFEKEEATRFTSYASAPFDSQEKLEENY